MQLRRIIESMYPLKCVYTIFQEKCKYGVWKQFNSIAWEYQCKQPYSNGLIRLSALVIKELHLNHFSLRITLRCKYLKIVLLNF